jgi:hypothetical protein
MTRVMMPDSVTKKQTTRAKKLACARGAVHRRESRGWRVRTITPIPWILTPSLAYSTSKLSTKSSSGAMRLVAVEASAPMDRFLASDTVWKAWRANPQDVISVVVEITIKRTRRTSELNRRASPSARPTIFESVSIADVS